MHDDFVITSNWLWKFLASRKLTELVHNGSMHSGIFAGENRPEIDGEDYRTAWMNSGDYASSLAMLPDAVSLG